MEQRTFPASCPSCGQTLRARRFVCAKCGTAVEGNFSLPVLVRLSPEEQEFVQHFIRCSGALKEMARVYGVSYPTVRNRLDALIRRVEALEKEQVAPENIGGSRDGDNVEGSCDADR